jgi:hypothetical protein
MGHVGCRWTGNVIVVDGLPHRERVDGARVAMHEPHLVELAEDAEHAARVVHVLDVVVRRGRHLADVRHLAREPIDVADGEGHLRLFGDGQEVKDGVRRSPHGDVERHRILERLERGDAARQDRRVPLEVVALGEVDDPARSLFEQLPALGVRRQERAVAGEREAERLVQAVHAVGREHPRARAARRAGRALDVG